MFYLSHTPINTTSYQQQLLDAACGAYVSFEGWVRNHNRDQQVQALHYHAYDELALVTGNEILNQVQTEFQVQALCIHRVGALTIGDLAVWVGVCAPHREHAFAACRAIIDRVKQDVPIWKQEFYNHGRDWLAGEPQSEQPRVNS